MPMTWGPLLQNISICHSTVTTVPAWMGALPKLTHLCLHKVQQKAWSFPEFVALQDLYIWSCNATKVAPHASNNKITAVPPHVLISWRVP